MFKKIIGVSLLAPILALTLALPTLAVDTPATTPTPAPTVAKPVDLACVQSAVDKRDNAIINAVGNYSTAIKNLLQARHDALKAGWGITDKKARRQALKDAWTAFRKGSKTAAQDARKAKRDAWAQFNTDRKACNGNASDEPAGGEGADANL